MIKKLNKAYKFRLYPNATQQEYFAKTFGSARFIYNKMLSDKIDYYKLEKKTLNNTPAQYKKEFEWLKEVDSLALANSQMQLKTAFMNFFKRKGVGFPNFKSRRNKKSYKTNNLNGTIKVELNNVKLPKIGFVKAVTHRRVEGKIKSATISQTPTGKYFVSILVEYEKEIKEVKSNKVIGLDFSMKDLYVSSDNEKANQHHYFRKSLDKIKFAQRSLSRKVKGSSNRNKQRLRLAKVHEKVSNQRNDFLHKTSTYLSKKYDAIIIETLDLKEMSKHLKLGKSVHDNSWATFAALLKYKSEQSGKQLVQIDKWFPSSKKCSNCGNVKEKLELSERTYNCGSCNLSIDRDYNASLNIKMAGTVKLAW